MKPKRVTVHPSGPDRNPRLSLHRDVCEHLGVSVNDAVVVRDITDVDADWITDAVVIYPEVSDG